MAEVIAFTLGLILFASPFVLIFLIVRGVRRKLMKKKKEHLGSSRKRFRSIDELITTNIQEFYPEIYTKGESELLEDGRMIYNYFREFDPSEEAKVFRELNVRVFEGGGKNFVFTTRKPNQYHMDNLKNLVNNLYSVYGKDDLGKGAFSQDDTDGVEYGYGISRMWTKGEIKPSVMLNYDEEEGISMTIFTTKKEAITAEV